MAYTLKVTPNIKKFKGQHAASSATITITGETVDAVIQQLWDVARPSILGRAILTDNTYSLTQDNIDMKHFGDFLEQTTGSKRYSYNSGHANIASLKPSTLSTLSQKDEV
ncbi:hypothetical protein HK100_006304, partial [Physocladia obscura]